MKSVLGSQLNSTPRWLLYSCVFPHVTVLSNKPVFSSGARLWAGLLLPGTRESLEPVEQPGLPAFITAAVLIMVPSSALSKPHHELRRR